MNEATITVEFTVTECKALMNCAGMIAEALIEQAEPYRSEEDEGALPVEVALMKLDTALVLEGISS